MNKVKVFTLAVLLAAAPALAHVVGDQSILPRRSGFTNYVKNPSAKDNKLYVTTSSATVNRDVSAGNMVDGYASFTCDTSSNGGYCEWDLDTLLDGDKTGDCAASAIVKGDGSLYSFQLLDGSANVKNQVALANYSDWQPVEVTFPCQSAAKVRLTQTTAGTSPAVNIARVYYGKWDGKGTASQSELVGTVVISGCASAFSTSSTSLASLGTQSGCTYTISPSGVLTAPSTNVMGFRAPNGLAPGEYTIEYEGTIETATASKTGFYQFTDGTRTARELSTIFSGASNLNVPGFKQTFSLPSGSGDATWQIYAKTDSGGTVRAWASSASPGTIRLYRYPLKSELVVRPNQTNYDWTAYTPTFTGFGTVSSPECQHKREGSDQLIRCKFAAGTTTATEARVSLAGGVVAAGTDKIPTIQSAGWAAFSVAVAGQFSVLMEPGVGYVTFGKQSSTEASLTKLNGSSLVSSGQILSFTARVPIAGWIQTNPAYQFAGSVTSDANVALRDEWAIVSGSASDGTTAPSSGNIYVWKKSSPWITSVTRGAAGVYTVNYSFSDVPSCQITPVSTGTFRFGTISSPSSSSLAVGIGTDTGGATDQAFHIRCGVVR